MTRIVFILGALIVSCAAAARIAVLSEFGSSVKDRGPSVRIAISDFPLPALWLDRGLSTPPPAIPHPTPRHGSSCATGPSSPVGALRVGCGIAAVRNGAASDPGFLPTLRRGIAFVLGVMVVAAAFAVFVALRPIRPVPKVSPDPISRA